MDRVIRAPNHLGDLVMALPALAAAPGSDVMVRAWLAPLLESGRGEMLPIGEVLPLAGMLHAAALLRRRRYERGVLFTPAFSAALLFALGGVRERRGTATDSRRILLTDPVPRAALQGMHRVAAYQRLAGLPATDTVPRLAVRDIDQARWSDLLSGEGTPTIGIFPGSNASSRRWEADRYADLVGRLSRRGLRVVVLGAGSERELTRFVAGEGGVDLGGRTDLPTLAAGLSRCALLVTNDSGPMHLAAAVGTPTISLWGPGNPAVTGPRGPANELLRGPALPCMPCVRNECPRRGDGYRECMRSIGVEGVEAVVLRQLGSGPAQ